MLFAEGDVFKELLSKEMNRKEFMAHIGALLLAVIGISALLRTLSDPNHLGKKANSGYGSSSYGGKEGGLK